MVLEKTLEGPLERKEIQPVHSEGDQPWDFFEGMMLKLKLQYFGHLLRNLYAGQEATVRTGQQTGSK